jgi:hypothetical protein
MSEQLMIWVNKYRSVMSYRKEGCVWANPLTITYTMSGPLRRDRPLMLGDNGVPFVLSSDIPVKLI